MYKKYCQEFVYSDKSLILRKTALNIIQQQNEMQNEKKDNGESDVMELAMQKKWNQS